MIWDLRLVNFSLTELFLRLAQFKEIDHQSSVLFALSTRRPPVIDGLPTNSYTGIICISQCNHRITVIKKDGNLRKRLTIYWPVLCVCLKTLPQVSSAKSRNDQYFVACARARIHPPKWKLNELHSLSNVLHWYTGNMTHEKDGNKV